MCSPDFGLILDETTKKYISFSCFVQNQIIVQSFSILINYSAVSSNSFATESSPCIIDMTAVASDRLVRYTYNFIEPTSWYKYNL